MKVSGEKKRFYVFLNKSDLRNFFASILISNGVNKSGEPALICYQFQEVHRKSESMPETTPLSSIAKF